MSFLCLCVTKKLCNCLSFFFFPSFLIAAIFGRTYRSFFACSLPFVTQDGATSIRLLSLDTLVNGFLKATLIVKFCMCECDIPCALEKIVIAALITRSSKITWQTKTILSFFTIFITTTVYMAIRLSTIVAFLEGLMSIKLCDL